VRNFPLIAETHMGVQNVMLLLTALYQFKVHDNFMERLRRSRFVPVTL